MTEQKNQISLELNRALFEGRGNDFINIVAECVAKGEIEITEAAAQRLLHFVRTAPPLAGDER